jgi:hypothetical protein
MNKKIKVTDSMGTILVTYIFKTLNNTLVYCGLNSSNGSEQVKGKLNGFGSHGLRGIHEKDVINKIEY